MKLKFLSQRHPLAGLLVLACLLFLPLLLAGAQPSWWSDWGVLNGNQPNDYVAVNQGQVKNITTAAILEINSSLAQFGGAGDNLLQLQAALSGTSATTNDYAPANLGQLKNLTAPIYDRLMAVGYQLAPLKSGSLYPWDGGTPNDYAMANIGQVKNLFSFDLTLSSDGSGLPDWWRHLYDVPPGTSGTSIAPGCGGLTYLDSYKRGLNPNDYYNGQTTTLAISGGDGQTGNPGSFLHTPLIVSVTGSNHQPFINAPVTFTVTQGGGILQRTDTSPKVAITLFTDNAGQAKVFFKLPDAVNSTSQITAITGNASNSLTVTFSEICDDGTGIHSDPFAPSNVEAQMNPDGSIDVTWTNNADPADPDPINIRYRDLNGNWVVAASVSAGANSLHIPPP